MSCSGTHGHHSRWDSTHCHTIHDRAPLRYRDDACWIRGNSQDPTEEEYLLTHGPYLNRHFCDCTHKPDWKYYSKHRYLDSVEHIRIMPRSCQCCCCTLAETHARRTHSYSPDKFEWGVYEKYKYGINERSTRVSPLRHSPTKYDSYYDSKYTPQISRRAPYQPNVSLSPDRYAPIYYPLYSRENPNDVSYTYRHSLRNIYDEYISRTSPHRYPLYPRSYNDDFYHRPFVPEHEYPEYIEISPPADSPLRGTTRRYYPDGGTVDRRSPYRVPHLRDEIPPFRQREDIKEDKKEPIKITEEQKSPKPTEGLGDDLARAVREEQPIKIEKEVEPIERARDDFEGTHKPKPVEEKKAARKEPPLKEVKEPVNIQATDYQLPDFKEKMPEVDAQPVKKRKRRVKKDLRRPKKSTLRRKPEAPVEVYHMEKNTEVINPRLEQIGAEMFKNQPFKPEVQPKKIRVASAKPKVNTELEQISEKEYLETVYPNVNIEIEDLHCSRYHYQEWFKDFLQRVYETGNKMKYDMFIKRCIKTSPYNENSGYNYALLKRLAGERSKSKKKSYERNTISYIAKFV